MRIGIDTRMAGTGEGIGRYVEQLVKNLELIDPVNDYYLISRQNLNFTPPNPKFRTVTTDSAYYSWSEQTRFIRELMRLQLDLMHFANFNFPMLYPGKFVTSIHDIIHHLFPGRKKSRMFHRLAYRMVMKSAVKRARRIIAVSETTKQDILKTFKVHPSKIEVVYEGVEKNFFGMNSGGSNAAREKYGIKKPYILFVGVWRQYKNLPRLAQAFDILRDRYQRDYELVLAGKVDEFYPEIARAVFGIRAASEIKAVGFVPDEDLIELYRGARIFVLPSLVEGFGLIGLEAQAAGVPVAASDIPVLREVLRDGAVFFDPQSVEDIAAKVNEVLSKQELFQELVARGRANAQKYDWAETARKTLEVYKEAVSK